MRKKIRLLYFGSDFQIGLTQAQTEQIEHLAKQDSIELFCISSENEQEPGLHDRLQGANVRMNIVKGLDTHANFKELCSQIAKIIKANNITHVNVHNNWQLALMSRLKCNPLNGIKVKLIYTIHGYRHNHPLKAILAIASIGGALALFADRVISMSDYVSRRFWFLNHKMDRIFYMMNKPEYHKKENIIDTTHLEMVFPAQFRKGKRQEMLIDALKLYMKRTGDNTPILHLPGNGPLLENIKEHAVKTGVAANVKFYGKISLSEVISLYERSNIALCSTNVETYGRCIAEPFMLGRCVITQKTGVAGDIIRDGENGFLFKTAEDLASILEYLHNNPSIIKDVANNAFKEREIFFPDRVMESYIASLEKA